ncbi:nuclear transport factor 2 domain-containing protein [Hyaloscypha bicolor E]|uniref:Nuclear transport factor 2 n=1 Tax=Hyaloscypha bicolor E TaxID=1095630 RepID=A0A2J6SY75_9HELO|nr:nuclear transport factor 2 domain-containing protein [Hyaloscypha bicolor E]PMD55722.1 nuclear transport factor 2 domain-containing protein [Hyaloscypha bicolor E]
MANFADVAKQFVEFYYHQFDADRKQLAPLYILTIRQRENSMLTFESASIAGVGGIVEKLSCLPFEKVKHAVSTLDAQPSENGGILILVTGALLVDEEERSMNYSQAFQLLPDGAGSYFIYNDIFKLVFG